MNWNLLTQYIISLYDLIKHSSGIPYSNTSLCNKSSEPHDNDDNDVDDSDDNDDIEENDDDDVQDCPTAAARTCCQFPGKS